MSKYLVVAISLLVVAPVTAGAQGNGAAADPKADVDRAVAEALYERGRILFGNKDWANAKQLFIESLVRDSKGPKAADAMAMLRAVNEKLGIKDLDSGKPGTGTTMDPYGTGGSQNTGGKTGTEPMNPYDTAAKPGKGPVDPYSAGASQITEGNPEDPYAPRRSTATRPGSDSPVDEQRLVRRTLMTWSAIYGGVLGLAIAGPVNDEGQVSGGALVGGLLGAGVGIGVSHYVTKKRKLAPGQALAIVSAGTWGAIHFGFLGDLVTGIDDSSTNGIYRSVALGGAVGAGVGTFFAIKVNPSEDQVAMMNSGGLYLGTAGLLLGAVMQPVESEGYSINAMVGSLAGITLGYFASKRLEMSRKRLLRLDIGAAVGAAATWALLYPAIEDSASNDDEQTAGLISMGTMAAGIAAAYYLTRKMDRKPETKKDEVALPGLIQRSNGSWSVGAAMPRPMDNRRLSGGHRGFSVGLDLLSGSW